MKLLALLVVAVTLFVVVENRKRKQKPKKPVFVESKLKSRRPDHISQERFCEACVKVTEFAISKLFGKKKEVDVFEVLEGICNEDNYSNRNSY